MFIRVKGVMKGICFVILIWLIKEVILNKIKKNLNLKNEVFKVEYVVIEKFYLIVFFDFCSKLFLKFGGKVL